MPTLITLAKAKSNYFDVSDNNSDAIVTDFIHAAEGSIKTLMLGQPMAQETIDLVFEGNRRDWYHTQFVGVPVTLSSLHSRANPSESWVAVSGAVVQGTSVYLSNGFTSAWYKLTLTVGFASGSVPAEVEEACGLLALAKYKLSNKSKENRVGVSSISITQNGVTKTIAIKDVEPHILTLLNSYRRTYIA